MYSVLSLRNRLFWVILDNIFRLKGLRFRVRFGMVMGRVFTVEPSTVAGYFGWVQTLTAWTISKARIRKSIMFKAGKILLTIRIVTDSYYINY